MKIVDRIDIGRVRCPFCKEKLPPLEFGDIDEVDGSNINGFGSWECPNCGREGMFRWDASFTNLDLVDEEVESV
ncbi:MAG: hypothetical protein IKP53_08220 [Candidatus Methanomethylophilaceae archaeon]|nr:hypothetical protein [Candidatus Methanomethylophilaceae archaeon]